MPSESVGGVVTGNQGAAILFIASATNALDVFSATNSSPWTAENFGGDKEKVDSLKEYVTHAVVLTGVTNIIGAIIAGSIWPIVGAFAASSYMWWLYERAIKRGMDSGSMDWHNAP